MAKQFTSYRKSMSLSPFPVTDLWPEVRTLLSRLKHTALDRLQVHLNIILF